MADKELAKILENYFKGLPEPVTDNEKFFQELRQQATLQESQSFLSQRLKLTGFCIVKNPNKQVICISRK